MDRIEVKNLTPNTVFVVRGKVSYSRIASFIEGKELEEAAKRDVAYNRKPSQKPYVKMSLYDAQVICKDPAQPTLEERYAIQSLYISNKAPELKNQFEKRSGGKFLPRVYQLDPTTGQYNQIENKKELGKSLDVSLVCRVYKAGFNTGISLDAVLVNEPVRYYEAQANKVLTDLGIVLNNNQNITTQESTENVETPNAQATMEQQAITSPYTQQAEIPNGYNTYNQTGQAQTQTPPPSQPVLKNPWG